MTSLKGTEAHKFDLHFQGESYHSIIAIIHYSQRITWRRFRLFPLSEPYKPPSWWTIYYTPYTPRVYRGLKWSLLFIVRLSVKYSGDIDFNNKLNLYLKFLFLIYSVYKVSFITQLYIVYIQYTYCMMTYISSSKVKNIIHIYKKYWILINLEFYVNTFRTVQLINCTVIQELTS